MPYPYKSMQCLEAIVMPYNIWPNIWPNILNPKPLGFFLWYSNTMRCFSMYTQFKKANGGQKWITAKQRDFAIKKEISIPDNIKTCKDMKEFLDGAMLEQVCNVPIALYCFQ